MFGKHGRYLSEIMGGNRLIRNRSKAEWVGPQPGFTTDRMAIMKSMDLMSNMMLMGFEDFQFGD